MKNKLEKKWLFNFKKNKYKVGPIFKIQYDYKLINCFYLQSHFDLFKSDIYIDNERIDSNTQFWNIQINKYIFSK